MARMGDVFEPVTISSKIGSVRNMFNYVAAVRQDFGIDLEDAMLYLCIGYLNTERIHRMGSRGFVSATNVSSVANFIGMPKETARRKINKMIEAGIVANLGGLTVADLDRWYAHVEKHLG